MRKAFLPGMMFCLLLASSVQQEAKADVSLVHAGVGGTLAAASVAGFFWYNSARKKEDKEIARLKAEFAKLSAEADEGKRLTLPGQAEVGEDYRLEAPLPQVPQPYQGDGYQPTAPGMAF